MKFLTLPDERRVAFRESGSGPPLVLLHGWSMTSAVFDELLADLGQDFHVLAPDLRGHGFSDPGPGYRLEDFAADIACWLESVEAAGAALLGWSLGGQVAIRLVLDHPTHFSRLVLIDTTPRFVAASGWEGGLSEGQVRSLVRNLRRAYEKTMGDFFALQFGDDEISRERYREIIDFAVRAGRLPEIEAALASLETLRIVDLRAELSEVAAPTLVIHGRNDEITPIAAGRFLADRIPAANLRELPETGHAPFLSRRAETLDAMREFLL